MRQFGFDQGTGANSSKIRQTGTGKIVLLTAPNPASFGTQMVAGAANIEKTGVSTSKNTFRDCLVGELHWWRNSTLAIHCSIATSFATVNLIRIQYIYSHLTSFLSSQQSHLLPSSNDGILPLLVVVFSHFKSNIMLLLFKIPRAVDPSIPHSNMIHDYLCLILKRNYSFPCATLSAFLFSISSFLR